VTFYSDGRVFISGSRIGINGWIGRTPPLPEGKIPDLPRSPLLSKVGLGSDVEVLGLNP